MVNQKFISFFCYQSAISGLQTSKNPKNVRKCVVLLTLGTFFDQNIFSQNLPKILNRIGRYPKIHLPITNFLVCFLSILCKNVANFGKVHKTIEGSSSWQVCVFKPGHTTFQASPLSRPHPGLTQVVHIANNVRWIMAPVVFSRNTKSRRKHSLRRFCDPILLLRQPTSVRKMSMTSPVHQLWLPFALTLQRAISGSFSWRK